MIPYIILIILVLICFFHRKPKLIILLLGIFAVCRYNTGWDYATYYNEIVTGTIPQRYSILWSIIFQSAHQLNVPHLGIVIPNVIGYICIYQGLSLLKLSPKNKVESLLMYTCWYTFFISSLSIIRQGLSEGFILIMFGLLQQKRYFLSLCFFLIAVWLHSSAIIGGILFFIYYYRNGINVFTVSIIIIVFIIAIKLAEIVTSLILGIGLADFSYYLKLTDDYGGKMVYLNVIIGLFFLYALYNQKCGSLLRQIYALSIMGFMGSSCIYFMGAFSPLTRMFDYFSLFSILGLFPALRSFKPQKIIRLCAIGALVSFFIVYLIWTSDADPISGYVPYKFILTR